MSDILEQLIGLLGTKSVLLGEDISARNVSYWDNSPMLAKAIVRPENTEDLAAFMALCHRQGQNVVPQGGRTNLVESCLSTADDIVLSLEKMNNIVSLDEVNYTATVEAGLILETLQNTLAESHLMFPMDFGARGSCTIGGILATNAGGTMVLKYGMARALVLGVEVVLPDGTIISSLNESLKNNTGYDLNNLFCGSEGTLGVITKAVLRLWNQPMSRSTALLACDSFENLTTLLKTFQSRLPGGLSAYEVMWNEYFKLNASSLMPGREPIASDYNYYVLAEYAGGDQALDGEAFNAVLESAFEQSLIVDGVVVKTESEREELWQIRDNPEPLEHSRGEWACFDVSLKISSMESFTDQLKAQVDGYSQVNEVYIYGHLGDGNLHLAIWAEREGQPFIEDIELLVYTLVKKFSGSISAEHGIGLEKRKWLSYSRSQNELALMRRIKTTFDPAEMMNFGKILQ